MVRLRNELVPVVLTPDDRRSPAGRLKQLLGFGAARHRVSGLWSTAWGSCACWEQRLYDVPPSPNGRGFVKSGDRPSLDPGAPWEPKAPAAVLLSVW